MSYQMYVENDLTAINQFSNPIGIYGNFSAGVSGNFSATVILQKSTNFQRIVNTNVVNTQVITISAVLVTSNVITLLINGIPIIVNYTTSSNNTMGLIATAITKYFGPNVTAVISASGNLGASLDTITVTFGVYSDSLNYIGSSHTGELGDSGSNRIFSNALAIQSIVVTLGGSQAAVTLSVVPTWNQVDTFTAAVTKAYSEPELSWYRLGIPTTYVSGTATGRISRSIFENN